MRSPLPRVQSPAEETSFVLDFADCTRHAGSGIPDSSGRVGNLPSEFGRYRILRPLGQGGMGSVYLAKDTRLNRKVALKTPSAAIECNALLLERFYLEARAAAAVSHPNICAVYDVDEFQGQPFLTMAYHRGRTLAECLDASGPVSAQTALPIVRKLACGLRAIHRTGIVHRDLKPSNVIMSPGGEPVIIDFGIVRRIEAADPLQSINSISVGTPAYMAPELITGGTKCTPAVDIFSLGVILYEMLSGWPPFSGSLATMMGTIVRDNPPAPTACRVTWDRQLDELCLRTLEKDPEKRFSSADTLIDAIDRYLSAR